MLKSALALTPPACPPRHRHSLIRDPDQLSLLPRPHKLLIRRDGDFEILIPHFILDGVEGSAVVAWVVETGPGEDVGVVLISVGCPVVPAISANIPTTISDLTSLRLHQIDVSPTHQVNSPWPNKNLAISFAPKGVSNLSRTSLLLRAVFGQLGKVGPLDPTGWLPEPVPVPDPVSAPDPEPVPVPEPVPASDPVDPPLPVFGATIGASSSLPVSSSARVSIRPLRPKNSGYRARATSWLRVT